MALWTDGESIDATTLAAIDSSVPKVASSESINIEGPGSVIRQAWTEMGDYLVELLQLFQGDAFSWRQGAVYSGLYAVNRSRFLLNQVIVSECIGNRLSAIETMTAYCAMTLFWKQAARRTDKDRYLGKLTEAEKDLRNAKKRFWSHGIPVVLQPLSAPGALYDPIGAGVWSAANITSTAGGGSNIEPESVDVAITYVDQTAYISPGQKQNAESGPAAIQTFNLGAGETLSVSISNLTPPGTLPNQVGIADGVYFYRSATGWNVYAAPSGQPLVLQNDVPISLSTFSYAMTSLLGTGALLTPGQVPDVNQRPSRPVIRA